MSFATVTCLQNFEELFTILFAFDWKFSEIQFKVDITNSTLSK